MPWCPCPFKNEAYRPAKVLLWQPKHGKKTEGPPRKDDFKLIAEDTDLIGQDRKNCLLELCGRPSQSKPSGRQLSKKLSSKQV